MTFLSKLLVASSLGALMLGASYSVSAQDAHHPPVAAGAPPAAAQSAPPPAAPGMGAMGGGMMNPAMMERMMGMMGGMGRHGGGMGMMSMMGIDDSGRAERVEGHLAFLRAELRITDVQAPLWTAFADAARRGAAKRNDTHAMMARLGPASDPVERLTHREHALSASLEGVRALRAALVPLYAALTDEQKKTFAELLPMRMVM